MVGLKTCYQKASIWYIYPIHIASHLAPGPIQNEIELSLLVAVDPVKLLYDEVLHGPRDFYTLTFYITSRNISTSITIAFIKICFLEKSYFQCN